MAGTSTARRALVIAVALLLSGPGPAAAAVQGTGPAAADPGPGRTADRGRAAVAGTADWSQYLGGPTHSGVNTAERILTPATVGGLRRLWTRPISGGLSPNFTVAGGTVYTTGFGGRHAIDAKTGAVRWKGSSPPSEGFHGAPVVAGDTVYESNGLGRVEALDTATGARRWLKTYGSQVLLGSPAYHDGTLYLNAGGFLAGNSIVVAANAATGDVLWSRPMPTVTRSTPAVADGRVYFGGGEDPHAWALDAATGVVVWSTQLPPQHRFEDVSPVVLDGLVLFGGVAVESATGRIRYTAETGLAFDRRTQPLAANGTVYSSCGRPVRKLCHLDAATGAVRVQTAAPAPWLSRVAGGVAYGWTRATRDTLHAVDLTTGRSLWSVNGAVSADPMVVDGVLYAQLDNAIVAFGLGAGSSASAGSGSSASASAGSAAVAARRDWPQFLGGSEHTGANPDEDAITTATVAGLWAAWSRPLPDCFQEPAVVAGDTVYTAGRGAYCAVDVRTGQLRWRVPVSTQFPHHTPVVVGDTVYEADGNGIVKALDTATGATRWSNMYEVLQDGPPSYADGALYTTMSDRFDRAIITAIDARSGAHRWSRHTSDYSDASPTVAAGRVYFVGRNTKILFCFDAETGAVVWQTALPTRTKLTSTAVYADGRVHVGTTAVDAQTGAVLWQTDLGPRTSDPQVAGGVVYVSCEEGRLCQLDARTGRLLRTVVGPVGWLARIAGDVYYAWGEDDFRFTLFATRITTGEVLWRVSGAGRDPVVVNGTLYARQGQSLTAFRLPAA